MNLLRHPSIIKKTKGQTSMFYHLYAYRLLQWSHAIKNIFRLIKMWSL